MVSDISGRSCSVHEQLARRKSVVFLVDSLIVPWPVVAKRRGRGEDESVVVGGWWLVVWLTRVLMAVVI